MAFVYMDHTATENVTKDVFPVRVTRVTESEKTQDFCR